MTATRSTLALASLALAVTLGAGHAQAQYGGSYTVRDETLNIAGRGEFSINLPGSLAYNQITPDGGMRQDQFQLYFVPALVGGVMVTDFLELRLQAGLQWLRTETGGVASQQTVAFQGAIQALFQTDFMTGMGGYAGVGLGGIVGNREAGVGAGASIDYIQYGGVAQVLLGVMLMPGPIFMMRGGFRLDILFGREEAQTTLPGFINADFLNVLGAFELSAGWRFG
ncbi:MAG: hypothetical protein H6719_24220 [Sandaracinaceae bacterium]|nr:hypothetical protein [Sandaracinaceae bacterium]